MATASATATAKTKAEKLLGTVKSSNEKTAAYFPNQLKKYLKKMFKDI